MDKQAGRQMKAVRQCFFGMGLIGLMVYGALALAGPVDEVIATRLQALIQSRATMRLDDTSVPRAVAEFYAGRQWQPVWDEPRLAVLLDQLAGMYTDGLNPEDYSFSRLDQYRKGGDTDPLLVAERDMLATRAYLLALLHLYHGKIEPRRLDSHWNFDARQFDPVQGLQQAREAVEKNEIAAVFAKARPAMPQYNSMRSALARLRSIALAGGWPLLPPGSPLKPGMSDARVAVLRERLQIAGLLPYAVKENPEFYDEELTAAVQRFQQEAYLDVDGAIGPTTRVALNIPVGQRIAQVRANLERMRWFLHEIKNDFVIVDLAGYRIAYMQNAAVKWKSRVQIGKAFRATPVFKSEISTITLSPSWVVPPTIFREDSLPDIRRNRDYLTRNKLHVFNAAGAEISVSSVNWWAPGNITLRQEPGASGALGELAIRFANPYSVYLHDTPHKELFSASRRATSSGCIRVENVHELAVLLFNDPVQWNREAMQKVIDERKTYNIALKKKIPIMMVYWTVDVGQDGYVSFRPDVYQRDPLVVSALDSAP